MIKTHNIKVDRFLPTVWAGINGSGQMNLGRVGSAGWLLRFLFLFLRVSLNPFLLSLFKSPLQSFPLFGLPFGHSNAAAPLLLSLSFSIPFSLLAANSSLPSISLGSSPFLLFTFLISFPLGIPFSNLFHIPSPVSRYSL